MDVKPIRQLKQNVTDAPKKSVKLAQHTAHTTFRITIGSIVTTEQESVRAVRAVIRRGRGHPPEWRGRWPRRLRRQSERDFEKYIEDYVRYLLQIRRMPTLTEVKQLEETIGRLMQALDQVIEEKTRVKAEHAGEVPSEWLEEMAAMLGRKPRPSDIPAAPPPLVSAPPPVGDPTPVADGAPARADGTSAQAAKSVPRMKEPFPGYRTLSAPQILMQIPALTPQQLRHVQQYEERHHRRITILRAVESQLAALGA
ncbi:MAG: hypothetical protein U0641_15490 [Anaerolineae bacterium]